MATVQLQGFTGANIAEVEATTKALRATLRPEDYGTLGMYSIGGASGTMAAGLAAAARVYSFRWGDATRLGSVKRVTVSAGVGATAFAAGTFIFNMFRVLSFSASDTNQTDLTPTGNMNKLRTSGMGTTLVSSIRIANTAVLSGGTLTTPDTNPVGTLVGSVPNTAGTPMLPPWPIWEAYPGEHPLILTQNEGFILQATVPATGVWQFSVRSEWAELASY